MPKRLETRIILSLALVLTAMIAVYGWWIGSVQSRIYVQELSRNLQVLARNHADDAAGFIIVQEYAGLEEHMLRAAGQPDVLAIQVIEPDGKLLCNIGRTSPEETPRLSYKIKSTTIPTGSTALFSREEGHLVSWTPIEAGKQLGWLKMTLSLHTADELQRSTWQSSILIGLLWILVGTVLMVAVVKKPLRAIRELSGFAHDLQNRKGGQVTVTRGVYEIDQLADALNHSSVELLSGEQLLMAQQEQLTVTLQSIGDGVIATDTENTIVLVNHVAEQLTGWSQEEALGRKLEEIFHLEGDTAGNSLQAVLAEKRTVALTGQIHLTARDSSERVVAVNGSPIINSSGKLTGMVLVFSDISEKTAMEAEKKKLEGS